MSKVAVPTILAAALLASASVPAVAADLFDPPPVEVQREIVEVSTGGWYLSGDLARKDEQGYFWFIGRSDDVIKSSGHLIGPFEVESALIEHPSVAESAVVGSPDHAVGTGVPLGDVVPCAARESAG